uniref:Potassium voltage-gated channel, subfamily G, member 3 n=1 Tax=Gouania willdenowi TaxID=441366 RepID=A0A8C5N3P1_GOUWI
MNVDGCLWSVIRRNLRRPRLRLITAPCTLNVGGRRFSFGAELMRRLPLSRLSRLHRCSSESELLELCDDYDLNTNEVFFDQHANAFSLILVYAQHGNLRLLYWGLDSSDLLPCCQGHLDRRLSTAHVHLFPKHEPCCPKPVQSCWREKVRRTFEEPTSSLMAQVVASVSMLFVVISTKNEENLDQHRVVEAVCISWFTAECLLRFLVSPDKCEFVQRPFNVIDLLAILPYYVSVGATLLTGEDSQVQRAGISLRLLQTMWIFWVIKLARHFLGLQTLGLMLRRCYRKMVMLLVFIGVAMVIFSSLAQLLEHGLDPENGNQDYASIPGACWWVIISMTTVGYGDMYPVVCASSAASFCWLCQSHSSTTFLMCKM